MSKMVTPAMERAARKRRKIKNEYRSPWANALHRLSQNRAAMISLAIVLLFLLCAQPFVFFKDRFLGPDRQKARDEPSMQTAHHVPTRSQIRFVPYRTPSIWWLSASG